jgi:nucleoside-diphosphate-sugar epimerase
MKEMFVGKFDGNRVLVTGASGFIGAHLCRKLHEEGAETHAVYRSRLPVNAGGYRWRQADLANSREVKQLIAEVQPDLIFHLASHVMGAPDLEHVLPTFQCNLQSTVNLLEAAAHSNCGRIILTGSLAEPVASNGEAFPSAPYAAAKWASSAYARMFHALYNLPVLIARVFMVYGPAQVDVSKLIPYVILALLQGRTPKISSGSRLLDWIYVSDVVDGFLALAQANGIEGETVDLGSGALISIREIVQKVAELLDGTAEFGAIADRPLEPTRIAKTEETFARIGWKAQVSLQEGLERTIEWYRSDLERSLKTNLIMQA